MKTLLKSMQVKAAPAKTFRASRLGAACVLALSGAVATSTMAQSVSFTFTPPTTPLLTITAYALWANNLQGNLSTQSATNSTIYSANFAGPGGVTPGSLLNNTAASLAQGNLYTGSSNLLATTLSLQSAQMASAARTANTTDASARITETGLPAAVMVLSGNTLSATTTQNQSTQAFTAVLPASLSAVNGSTSGGADQGSGAASSATTGSINVGTYQAAVATGASSAAVSTGTVLLDLKAMTTDATANLTVNSNAINAAYQANNATNQITALAGSSALAGSAVVTNIQANVNSTSGTGSVTGSSIRADYRDGGAGNTDLSGDLTINNNSISGTAAGNTAGARSATGQVLAANSIVLASGVDVAGAGVALNLIAVDTVSTQNLTGGLVVFNGQRNTGSPGGLTGSVANGQVTVSGDNMIAGGSITATGNSVASAATGNLAGNLISANATSFVAAASAGNIQGNYSTPITASNTGAAITVGVGFAGSTVEGAVTLGSNTIGATAEGNVAATSLSFAGTNLTSRSAGTSNAVADTFAGTTLGLADVAAGSSATNIQGNYGAATIGASLTAASVAVNFTSQTAPGTLVTLSNADATVNSNTIQSKVTGNTGATTVALSGTTGDAQAGVSNVQINQSVLQATITNSGAAVDSGGVTLGSAVAVNSNTVAAQATANMGSNNVSAAFTNLTVGAGAFVATTTDAGVVTNQAALGIASNQNNRSNSTVSNITTGAFATANVGSTASGVGVTNSDVNVNNNIGSAASTGNQVANTVSIDVGNLVTSTGAATQIGGISNLQNNLIIGGQDSVTVGSAAGAVPLIGVQFQQALTTANVSVASNAVAASATGNTAANRIAVTGGSLASISGASGAISGDSGTGATSVNNEFALVNRQNDGADGGGRNAAAQSVMIGINSTGAVAGGITGSNLTVQNNRVTAEVRNNNATNAIAFTGATSLDTGAGVLNLQSSSVPASADMTSQIRINSAALAVGSSNLALTGNTSQALAVGSSAANSINAAATNLSGNALIPATTGGSAITALGLTTANADYGIANAQTQSGSVSAVAETVNQIGLSAAAITGGAATLTGNAINAVAQATSATNGLALSGTNANGLTGAVVSSQTTDGDVEAVQTRPGAATFLITGASTSGTPLVVANNAILVSAGQNEAFNTQSVRGTTVSGGARGNNDSSFSAISGDAATGSDFTVLNVQGGNGNVSSTANPGLIGVNVSAAALGITGSSVSVSDNTVLAKSTVNNASNALNLEATGALNATGAVSNVQNVTGGAVTALVNTGNIGVSPAVATVALNGTAATVSGNLVTAQAGANSAANALNAVAGSSIAGGGANSAIASAAGVSSTDTTFAVLNFQTNAATANATITGMTIGISTGAAPAGLLFNTTASVQGNQLLAYGYGNSANNTLGMSALPGTLNQATAGINNVQVNTASINAAIASSVVGLNSGGSTSGGAVIVSSNTSTAQSIGNSATNRIAAR